MWTVECLNTRAGLSSLQGDWDRLAAGNPMRSFAWAKAWLETIGRETTPNILIVKREGCVEGILPLALETTLLRGRRLILIGSKKACGDDLGLLATPDSSQHVAKAIVDWLHRGPGYATWDFLDFDGVQPQNPTSQAFLTAIADNARFLIEKRLSPSCWAIDLPNTWDEYLIRLTKRMRKILRDQERDYVTPGRAQLKVATTLDEARTKLNVIADLHQSRWSEKSVNGCFGTEGFKAFLDQLLDAWWDRGIAFVASLQLDGKDVAGAYGFWERDELAMYLVGMDVASQEHRPGWMLNAECIQHAMRLGRKRINFLRGDEEYKARLGATPSSQERWIVTSSRVMPRLRHRALQKGMELRNWMRSRATTS